MTENIIRGEFEYNGSIYPFVIQNRIMTVVQAAYHYLDDFLNKEDLGILSGVTDTNKNILLLDCRVLHPQFISLSGKVQIALHGYILQNKKEDRYDRIKFSSLALDTFYSPRKAWTPQIAEGKELSGLTMNSYGDSAQQILINIMGENIYCTLDFESYFNLRLEERHAMSIMANFSMVFENQKTAAELGKYYLYLRDFLSFANFRKDIPFDEITLWCQGVDSKFVKTGIAVIFQTDNITYDTKPQNTITYDDLDEKSFSSLFKEIAELRSMQGFNPYFLPVNKSDSNVVDRAKWLVTAISFEGEFNKKYKDFKAEQSQEFHSVKTLLLATIDQAVAESGVTINNPKNSSLKSFKNLIEHCDTTIREKFKFCSEHFSLEIEDVVKNYCNQMGVSKDTNFAEVYAVARNRTAHGVIEQLENEDILVFVILRCFIYLLIMERASIPPIKMKAIITKLI